MNEREKALRKLCRNCNNNKCTECPFPLDLNLENIKLESNKTQEEQRQENAEYLKVMEGYKNFDKSEECTHQKVKTQTAFKPLENTNLEIAELICAECQQFLGLVYRTVKYKNVFNTQNAPFEVLERADKTFAENKLKLYVEKDRLNTPAKFITFANNRNFYTLEKKKS